MALIVTVLRERLACVAQEATRDAKGLTMSASMVENASRAWAIKWMIRNYFATVQVPTTMAFPIEESTAR